MSGNGFRFKHSAELGDACAQVSNLLGCRIFLPMKSTRIESLARQRWRIVAVFLVIVERGDGAQCGWPSGSSALNGTPSCLSGVIVKTITRLCGERR